MTQFNNALAPKIQLVGEFDTVQDAWKASRPHLSGEDLSLHQINDIDLPVHGMAVYSFIVTGSIAMRDLCFMLRPQSGAWAISDRTIDLKENHLFYSTEVPEDYIQFTLDSFSNFIHLKEAEGVPQDLCKSVMSYGRVTTFCFVCDKRTLANVVKGLRKFFPIQYEYYGKQFETLVPELANTPGGDWLLNDLVINDADKKALAEGPTKMGRMNVVGGKIQGVLLAQFIRKIYDKVYSNIINHIKDGSIYGMHQTEEFETVMYLPDSALAKMQSTRTCAFAMFDKATSASWDYVLQVQHLTTDEFKAQLPCGGCADKCAFRKEQLPRLISGNNVDYDSKGEVNPPCAIQTGIKATHKVRGIKFQSDSKVYDKWTEMLDTMDLTLTDDGREYLKNVNIYGFAEAQDNEPERQAEFLSILNKGHEGFLKTILPHYDEEGQAILED
jgi:hypothetical protein